jgi:uncharacterized protein
MDIIDKWPDIRKHFNKSFRTNFHVSIASVDMEGNPTVTPIGSLFLNGDQTGFYFEKFPSKLPEHARHNSNICILAVKSGTWFWLRSLFQGYFKTNPAIKLYGQLGNRRNAKASELERLRRRMRYTTGLKGHDLLWGSMPFVRDISFTKAEVINLGRMTERLT